MSVRKLFSRFLISLTLLFIALFAWIYFNSFDDPELNDLGLLAQTYFPDDQDNGYTLLKQRIAQHGHLVNVIDRDQFYKLSNNSIEWDQTFVERLIAANTHIDDLLERVFEKPSFAIDEAKDAFALPSYEEFYYVTRFLLLRSMWHLSNNNQASTMDDLERSIQFARLLKQETVHTLIAFMIGQAAQNHTLYYLDVMNAAPLAITEKTKQRALNILSSMDEYTNDGFKQAFAGEFRFINNYSRQYFGLSLGERWQKHTLHFNEIKEYPPRDGYVSWFIAEHLRALNPYYFSHPNRTLNVAAPIFIDLQKKADKSCDAVISNETLKVDDYSGWHMFLPNSMGNQVINNKHEYFGYFDGYFPRRCHVHTYKSAVMTKYALALFHTNKGHYPESLGELVPSYLPKIPVDYFGGGDLIYEKLNSGNYRLYSLGEDLIEQDMFDDVDYPRDCSKDHQCRLHPVFIMNFDPM